MAIKIEIAKEKIDNQLLKAIYANSPLNRFHPIRIIQALKSLIGIDIDNPSKQLIFWGVGYLEQIESLPVDYFKYSISAIDETIVLSKLGEQILLKNKNSCISELQNLCSVSDGNQIFEYLLEFSSINNICAIPFIWSAYKTNLFLKNKYSYNLLLLSIGLLIKNKLNQKGLMSNIEKSCIIESVRNSELTRQNRINIQLDYCKTDFNLFNDKNNSQIIDVLGKGRIAILDYLNSLDLKYITKEMILFLDACRMILKDSDSQNHQKISNILNYTIESKLYVNKNW